MQNVERFRIAAPCNFWVTSDAADVLYRSIILYVRSLIRTLAASLG